MICENFKYRTLIDKFEQISAIPRGSYHEDKIVAFLVGFAEERGLEYYTDGAKNVLINIPATKGYEDRAPVLLQGHTDMVCEKNVGCEHDFLNDGLELYEDGGFIKARGTTLGADDGYAVAVMLAVLDGAVDAHPACQCLFTASEEVGLDGAKAFDYSRIFARKMINMDAAEEDKLIVGCAGGIRSDSAFGISYAEPKYKNTLKISIGGLMGGHSGENINDGRANAISVAVRLLETLKENVGVQPISINGGSKDNAIPRECDMVLAANSADKLKRVVADFEAEIKAELCAEDKGFFISVIEEKNVPEKVFADEFTERVIDFVNSIKLGVLRMSDKIEGLVEYSRNLGIVRVEGDKLGFYFSSRSAIDEQIEFSKKEIEDNSVRFGGETAHHSRYPGWNYTGSSALADESIKTAKSHGIEVERMAIHAGLECGIIKKAIPDMDIISCGPNVYDLHSPMERMEIASFERFFGIIKAMLER